MIRAFFGSRRGRYRLVVAGQDTTPPGLVTNLAVTNDTDSLIEGTYTPPADADLAEVYIVVGAAADVTRATALHEQLRSSADTTFSISHTLAAGTYKVRAVCVDGSFNVGAYTTAVDAVVPSGALPAPGAFTLTATVINSGRVNLSWTASSDAATYDIKRQTGAGGYATLQSVAVGTTTYADLSVSPSTTYDWKITAINQTASTDSNVETDTTPAQGAWPDNDPSDGSWTTVVSSDGSDKYYGSGGGAPWSFGAKWLNDAIVSVETEAGSPNASVIRKRFFVGDASGWNGNASLRGSFASPIEMYVRYIYKLSSNWDFHSGGDKLIMLDRQSNTGSMYVGMRQTNRIQCHWQKGAGPDQAIYNSDPSVNVTVGVWHTIEWHHIGQSASNVADGEEHIWFDGVLLTWTRVSSGGSFTPQSPLTGMNFIADGSTTRVNGFQQVEFWGGNSDIKTVNDWIDVGEFVIKVKY